VGLGESESQVEQGDNTETVEGEIPYLVSIIEWRIVADLLDDKKDILNMCSCQLGYSEKKNN